jgi:hypothetical protein
MYKYNITNKDIDAVPKFKILLLSKREESYVRLMCQYVLYLAMYSNKSNEVGLLLDSVDYSRYKWFFGSNKRVTVNNIYLHNTNPDYSNRFIFIHNHPNNTSFSLTDLRTFLSSYTIFLAIAIQNNGTVHILCKKTETNIDDYNWFVDNYKTRSNILKNINTATNKFIYKRSDHL